MKRKQHFSGQKVKEPVRGRKEAAAGLEKENGSGKKNERLQSPEQYFSVGPLLVLGVPPTLTRI